ncbi:MAG: hypothetical protein ACOX1O_01380 [Eggerthellaceae bacterium]|jgi:hypothetical protein
MAKFCWETRGCEGPNNNFDHCPHYMKGSICPKDCQFSWCTRKTHKQTDDIMLLLDPDVDRTKAIKEYCYSCEFFLKHGPRTSEDEPVDLSQYEFGRRPDALTGLDNDA